MNEIELRRLVIKAFHVRDVSFGERTRLEKFKMVIDKNRLAEIIAEEPLIEDIKIEIIMPGDYNREINTIMDIVPISTKVLGKMGEGITHTLTGVVFMLTGADENGNQMHEFGASNGNLKEKLVLDRAGTPSSKDIIIHMDVVLKGGHDFDRKLPNAAFKAGDSFLQIYRDILKKLEGKDCTESHEYYDKIRPGGKKILIIKQIAGQGAMYDNMILPKEPSGFIGGKSIIDLGNTPIMLTPNEYRDGALRSME